MTIDDLRKEHKEYKELLEWSLNLLKKLVDLNRKLIHELNVQGRIHYSPKDMYIYLEYKSLLERLHKDDKNL